MVTTSLMVYLFSEERRSVSALFRGLLLISALIFGLWLTNIAGNVGLRKPLSTPSTKVVYGVNVDMTAMVPGTPYTVKMARGGNFFDLAAQLGINTLRITDIRW